MASSSPSGYRTNFIDVMPVEWSDDPNVDSPYPRTVGIDSTRTPFFNNVQGCRKWIGPTLQTAPISTTTAGTTVTITNHTAATVAGPFGVQYTTLKSPMAALSDRGSVHRELRPRATLCSRQENLTSPGRIRNDYDFHVGFYALGGRLHGSGRIRRYAHTLGFFGE